MAKLTAARAAVAAATTALALSGRHKTPPTDDERKRRRERGMRAKGRGGKPLKKVVRKKQRERGRANRHSVRAVRNVRDTGARGRGAILHYTPALLQAMAMEGIMSVHARDKGHFLQPLPPLSIFSLSPPPQQLTTDTMDSRERMLLMLFCVWHSGKT